jgi:hypothetical protein
VINKVSFSEKGSGLSGKMSKSVFNHPFLKKDIPEISYKRITLVSFYHKKPKTTHYSSQHEQIMMNGDFSLWKLGLHIKFP